jgi:hypothetical protein
MKKVARCGPGFQVKYGILEFLQSFVKCCSVVRIEPGVGVIFRREVVEMSVGEEGPERWALDAALNDAAVDRDIEYLV